MTEDALLSAWVLEREAIDLDALAAAAEADALGPPDLRFRLLSTRGDNLTVQLAQPTIPPPPGALLFVERHGAFELLRREPWPGGRVLLTMAAWPRR
jgi:hypothetical protein